MSDDDVNWEYYRGLKTGTEMAATRIAELEAEVVRLTAQPLAVPAELYGVLESELVERWNSGYTEGYNEAFERYGSSVACIAELEAAVLAEREACAKVAENNPSFEAPFQHEIDVAERIAAAIRARPAP